MGREGMDSRGWQNRCRWGGNGSSSNGSILNSCRGRGHSNGRDSRGRGDHAYNLLLNHSGHLLDAPLLTHLPGDCGTALLGNGGACLPGNRDTGLPGD